MGQAELKTSTHVVIGKITHFMVVTHNTTQQLINYGIRNGSPHTSIDQ